MKKRILSIFLAAVLLLTCVPLLGAAAQEDPLSGLKPGSSKGGLTASLTPVKETAAKRGVSYNEIIPYSDMEDQSAVNKTKVDLQFLVCNNNIPGQIYCIQFYKNSVAESNLVAECSQNYEYENKIYTLNLTWDTATAGAGIGDYMIVSFTYNYNSLTPGGEVVEDSISVVPFHLVSSKIPLKSISLINYETGKKLSGYTTISGQDAFAFYVSYNPKNATGTRKKKIVSSNSDLVTIEDFAGLIVLTPNRTGKTTITVTVDGVSSYFGVEVKSALTALHFDKPFLSMQVGAKEQLTLRSEPQGITPYGVYTWKNSNASVVHIDETGTVTAVQPGLATVTCTVEGCTATCKVSVYAEGDVCKEYEDIDRASWYHNAADFVIKNGYMGSTSTSRKLFSPTVSCTRAMIVSILYSLSGKPEVTAHPTFPDVDKNAWYAAAVAWAANAGVVSGYSNGKFGPNDNITREQLAVILRSYTQLVAGKDVSARADLSRFPDANKATWSKPYMEWAVKVGVLSGRSSGGKTMLAPQGTATRAEVAAVLWTFTKVLPEQPAQVLGRIALIDSVPYPYTEGEYDYAFRQALDTYCKKNALSYAVYTPGEDSTAARIGAVDKAYADGVRIFLLPGYLFGEVIIKVQTKYPDAKFIGLDLSAGDLTTDFVTFEAPAKNTVCISYKVEQIGYLAGYAAVAAGYRHPAFLGGMAVPEVMRYGYGFVQGANAAAVERGIADKVTLHYGYANQFFGDPDITAYMSGLYQDGVDIAFSCGGGVYTSVGEAAAANGGKMIGVDVDQALLFDSEYGKGITFTSAAKNFTRSVEVILDAIKNGNFSLYGGQCLTWGIDVADPAKNHVGLPASTQWNASFTEADYQALVAKIAAGTVTVSDDIDAMPKTAIRVIDFGAIK